MREIKFRAWARFDNVMLSNSDIWFRTNVQGYELFCDTPDNRDSWILMQYTGLHDRNGVDIYEGDIVKYFYFALQSETVYIEHSVGLFGGYELKDVKTKKRFGAWSINSEKWEVIGNIYENPELLEKR